MNCAPIDLTNVTVCAVSGLFLPQTIRALDQAGKVANFGETLLVTDRPAAVAGCGAKIVAVESLRSRNDYSRVVLQDLANHVRTDFVMIVQWDGYPVRRDNWTDEFFDYDYVGAPWPQFASPRAVGNGGFSLRSRRLLEACKDPRFVVSHPEDISICHENRVLLEGGMGLRFAPSDLATRFSYERSGDGRLAFGFHGLFNLPTEMGEAEFLEFFSGLDRSVLGLRELCDLREVLRTAATPTGQTAARELLGYLFRTRAHELAFWRYLLFGPVSRAEIPALGQ